MTGRADSDQSPPVSRRELRLVLAGLMLALTLAALDQNIVGTALPRIVSDLGGLAHLSWVVTAFLLTSTATTPLYGKLSDIYGRKPLFVTAILIFLAGSALCGLSQTMTELIIFRGIQGLGAGGLISLAQTTIADVVAPRERGRYQGLFSGVFAICSVAGPLLGGLITDALTWRWIFFVNVPVGAAALLLIVVGFRRPHTAVARQIDYSGAFFLTTGTTGILLVLSWGGTLYSWWSPEIVALATTSLLMFILFRRRELRAPAPLFPPSLFENKVFVIAAGVLGTTAMALFGALVFLPLYFQLVLGKSPSAAGLLMAPLMGGVIVASIVGGRLVSITGRYKMFPIIGLISAIASFLTMAWAALTGAEAAVMEVSLITLGAGLGLVMPTNTVAIQNAVERSELGIATAAAAFFRSLGSALGVAISGAIMTATLHQLLTVNEGELSRDVSELLSHGLRQIAELPAAEREAVVSAYRHSIAMAFLSGGVVAALSLTLALFLPERPLRQTLERTTGSEAKGGREIKDELPFTTE